MSENRFNPYFAVFLVFRKEDKILLSQRFNTGHEDGNYSMVSGHVDEGESFLDAAIREGSEEAGIEIEKQDLSLAYILHVTKPDKVYIDTFLFVNKYKGELKNMEANKCSDLSWFDIKNLPQNTIEYVKFVIKEIEEGKNFGEFGWEKNNS